MSDPLTPEQRHRCMSHILSRDTKPELKVRHWLWQHGYRYRLNVKGVPGKPDIVMRRYRTAIFVNGCFWHGHNVDFDLDNAENGVRSSECCKIPKSNTGFWISKIRRNQERDRKNCQLLIDNGWQVIILWECQLKPKTIENTMQQVEIALNDYFIRTFSRNTKPYVSIDEDSLPIAAEDAADYE